MCLNLNERKFDRSEDSDKNLTMHATKIFNEILDKVKMSNLNFCIQMSPFSANISLKKSFIKDKSGAYILPSIAAYLSHNNDHLSMKLFGRKIKRFLRKSNNYSV